MSLSTSKIGRGLRVAALGLCSLGIGSCDAAEQLAEQCQLNCAKDGVAEGNFAISGYVAIDTFFKSVVGFKSVAGSVAADIKAELDGIQLAFGVSDADLAVAKGDLGAAIRTKLETTFKAKVVVDAQPAECTIDASVSASATVNCQASAGCDVDPGKASVTCMGQCRAEVNAMGKCEAEAELTCEVSGPTLTCEGECSGSCDIQLSAAAACDGTCKGTCTANCEGDTDAGANCNGQCKGMCMGSCKVGGMAAIDCKGKCEGSCKATAPQAGCMGGAKASCEFEANAKVECKGSCEGEFEPPKVKCDASASCEASAKAEAKFSAKCTPPSLDVRIEVDASLQAEVRAQLEFARSELRVRMPRLLAAIKKSKIVGEAGLELGSKGATAIQGTLDAVAEGDIDAVAAFKIAKCVPSELGDSAAVIRTSGEGLKQRVAAAGSVTTVLNLRGGG